MKSSTTKESILYKNTEGLSEERGEHHCNNEQGPHLKGVVVVVVVVVVFVVVDRR
jgi:hypothetical protein